MRVRGVNTMLRIVVLCLSLAVAGGAAGAARADLQDHDMADRIYEKYKNQRDDRRDKSKKPEMRVSLDQAVNKVKRMTKGKVIGARTDHGSKSITHRIKVLEQNSRVRTYSVDGVTGRVRR